MAIIERDGKILLERRADAPVWSLIAGASTPRYTPVAEDAGFALRVAVSAPEVDEVISPATDAVAATPKLVARPSIAGRPRVGAKLVARRGTWSGTNLRYRIERLRCRRGCAPVATGATYRVRPRDRGARFRIEVTASNSLGAVAARSESTGSSARSTIERFSGERASCVETPAERH